MDCAYEDDGGATVELNVNNNLNSNSLLQKSSANLLERNNNEKSLITEKSDAQEVCNGNVVIKVTEKNSPAEITLCPIASKLNGDLAVVNNDTDKNSPNEISLCTITNYINEDLSVGNDKSDCKSLPETILQPLISNELNSAEESLVENGKRSSTNHLDECTSFVYDSEKRVVDQTDISDTDNANKKTVNCIEKLVEKVSEEKKQNSNSCVGVENCSDDVFDICSSSAANSNLQRSSDALKECNNVKSEVPETCINTKSNEEIPKSGSVTSISEFVEVLDECISDEEVYLEVDDVDEQGSDPIEEKLEEVDSQKEIDLKSSSICEDASNSLKTNESVNENKDENGVSTNIVIFAERSADEGLSKSEMFMVVDCVSEKQSIDFEISNENRDIPLVEKSSEAVCSLNPHDESPQSESKSELTCSVNGKIEGEKKNCENTTPEISENLLDMKSLESNNTTEENSSKNDAEMSVNANTVDLNTSVEENSSINDVEMSENANTVNSNVSLDKDSSKNDVEMEMSDNANTVDSNIATEENSSKKAVVMEMSKNANNVDSNIAAEENSSKNDVEMDMSENANTVDSDIAAEEGSSKNDVEMEVSEHAKTLKSDIVADENIPKNGAVVEMSENTRTLELDVLTDGNSANNALDIETNENATDMDANENAKTFESGNISVENSSQNAVEMETIENAKTVEQNIAAEGNCSQNSIEMDTNENDKAVKSNIAGEENSSKNASDMETGESTKTEESKNVSKDSSSKNVTDIDTCEKANEDDFVILSDIEWSDDDEVSDEQKTKVEAQKVEKEECAQNPKGCPKEKESQEGTANENPDGSSDGDDFNLDDVIEEFAKEESKVVKLSDDELDDLVEEFVEAECSSPSVTKKKESESKDLPSESDDEMELLIEDFKAVDSDNDCFIVQDNNNVVVINDDDKDSQPKKKKSKPNDSQSCTGVNSSDKIKSDAILSSSNSDKKSESEASDKTQESEVVNNEANAGKKTFEIGFFKSEIFDNEENKQGDGTKNKGEVSIVSALPLTQSLSGGKVTLECRTDGIYLKRDENSVDDSTSSHGTNENGEKRSTNLNADISNNESNGCDEHSVHQSVTNGTNPQEEEQCMDDMLNKVCLSNSSNSTSIEECKNSVDEDRSKNINSSIHSEGEQVSSEIGDVKSLGSLCHDTLEESKKRKLDVLDSKPDEPPKKIKTEINGAETDMDTAQSSTPETDDSVRKKVLQHFAEAFPTRVQLKKSWLEKMSKRLCRETLLEEYKQKIGLQNNLIKDLEDKLQTLEEELYYSQSQATTFVSVQQELFQKHHFIPQECDVPQPLPLPAVTKAEVPTHTTEIHDSNPVSSTPPIKVQGPQKKVPTTQLQQPAVPQTVASTRFVSNTVQPRAITTNPQRFVPLAPNVNSMTKEVVPGTSNSQSVPPQSIVAAKSHPQLKTYSQLIDLTDEESANKKLLPALSTQSVSMDIQSERETYPKIKFMKGKRMCSICETPGPVLFKIPSDENVYKYWFAALQWNVPPEKLKYVLMNGRICNRHFDESCFTSTLKKKLNKFACPQMARNLPSTVSDTVSSPPSPTLLCSSVEVCLKEL